MADLVFEVVVVAGRSVPGKAVILAVFSSDPCPVFSFMAWINSSTSADGPLLFEEW